MNYTTLSTDVRAAAASLAEEVERVVEETGFERIHVIGHSLGGLIGRYYVTRLGGDARVHTLVTLGTPHEGTWAAYAMPTRLMQQMRPGSGVLRELALPVRGCRTRFIAYWSDSDEAILPQRSAALRHPDLRSSTHPPPRGRAPHPADDARGRPRHLHGPGVPRHRGRDGHLRRPPPPP